jgi:hypothetical protein
MKRRSMNLKGKVRRKRGRRSRRGLTLLMARVTGQGLLMGSAVTQQQQRSAGPATSSTTQSSSSGRTLRRRQQG